MALPCTHACNKLPPCAQIPLQASCLSIGMCWVVMTDQTPSVSVTVSERACHKLTVLPRCVRLESLLLPEPCTQKQVIRSLQIPASKAQIVGTQMSATVHVVNNCGGCWHLQQSLWSGSKVAESGANKNYSSRSEDLNPHRDEGLSHS